jgi:hypothetical protein
LNKRSIANPIVLGKIDPNLDWIPDSQQAVFAVDNFRWMDLEPLPTPDVGDNGFGPSGALNGEGTYAIAHEDDLENSADALLTMFIMISYEL